MSRISTIWLGCLLAAAPVEARAQGNWDLAAMGGVFAGHEAEPATAPFRDNWFQTGQGGVVLGRYVTPHLKFELEMTGTGEGTQFVQRHVSVPGFAFPYPVGAEAHRSVRSLGTALTWQFLENQWIHPFVQAGLSTNFDRRTVHTWPQNFNSGDPRQGGTVIRVAEEMVEGPHSTTAVRAAVGGGWKLYLSPKLFVRTDGCASFGPRNYDLAFRVGFGADF